MLWILARVEAPQVESFNNQQGPFSGSQVRPLSEVVRGAPGRRQIALTFDGGSSADALPELLAALRGASVKCTFFLTGEWVQRYQTAQNK